MATLEIRFDRLRTPANCMVPFGELNDAIAKSSDPDDGMVGSGSVPHEVEQVSAGRWLVGAEKVSGTKVLHCGIAIRAESRFLTLRVFVVRCQFAFVSGPWSIVSCRILGTDITTGGNRPWLWTSTPLGCEGKKPRRQPQLVQCPLPKALPWAALLRPRWGIGCVQRALLTKPSGGSGAARKGARRIHKD